MKVNNRSISIFILIFIFIIYGNSLKNKYALDDDYVTVTNPKHPDNLRVAKGIKGIPEIFSSHYVQSKEQSFEYRPIPLSTFAIEYQFFGSNPFISHFINVLIYALTCLLLFRILCKLLKNYNVVFPLLIIVLFIAHPIHTEVVSNIKCRDELLSFLFGICSLHFFLKTIEAENKKWMFILLAILLLLMALLCKKTATLFIALIPLTIYFFTTIKLKRLFILSSIYLLSFLLFIIIQRALVHDIPVLREFAFFENPLFYEPNFFKRIPIAFYTMGYYLRLLVFPYPLCSYYGYNTIPMVGFGSPIVIASAIFYFAMGVYALVKLPKKNILSYGIIVFLIGVYPFANINTPVVGIVGERFIYIASLGFCVATAYLLLFAFKVDYKNSAIGLKVLNPSFTKIILIILFLFSVLTISRNNKWKDVLTLFRNDVQQYEKSCNLHYLIGTTLYPEILNTARGAKKDAMIKEATFHYKQALQLMIEGIEKYPKDFTTLSNIGTIYVNVLNDAVSAQPYFKKSLAVNPNNIVAQYNFAFCYEKRNLADSAIISYEKMVAANTTYPLVYIQLHELYIKKEEYKKAIACDESAIKQIPTKSQLYVNLGNALILNKDTLNGVKTFEKAVELEPANINLRRQVLAFLKSTGYISKAENLNKK